MRKKSGGVLSRWQARLEKEDGEAEAGDELKIKREEVEDVGCDLPDSPTPTLKQILMG